jgi:5-methyltetrahydropteroyltriglutamate--homocysteine methyltransferase
MRRSEDLILTTHPGSLPRPPQLTRLYAERARGESIDPAELGIG